MNFDTQMKHLHLNEIFQWLVQLRETIIEYHSFKTILKYAILIQHLTLISTEQLIAVNNYKVVRQLQQLEHFKSI